MLRLDDDDYSLESLKADRLFENTQVIADIVGRLIDEIKPTAFFSVFPEGPTSIIRPLPRSRVV